MLRSSFIDFSDIYILLSGTIKSDGAGTEDTAKQLNERNKKLVFKNCALFIDCISEINNAQVDHAKRYKCCDVNV